MAAYLNSIISVFLTLPQQNDYMLSEILLRHDSDHHIYRFYPAI